jgi:site-specific recombinase XerD
MSEITVESSFCYISSKVVYALYDEQFPVVPATIYLRHLEANIGRAQNTVEAYAYALKSFFDFLKMNGSCFWNISQVTIKSYKRFCLDYQIESGVFRIKRVTAQQYLGMLKQFIAYWRGIREDDPLFIDHVAHMDGRRRKLGRRGALSRLSWYSRIPNNLWLVGSAREKNQVGKRYKGLFNEDVLLVRNVLDQAERHTDVQRLLYYRNRAIWAFMLMTFCRLGELVRFRLEDLDQRHGYIYLCDRPEDGWLGELKTGAGEIFVTTLNPYWAFINSWLIHGRWIAINFLKSRGLHDNGMLFCNADGGPLTKAAVYHLFSRLKESCGFGASKPFSPHVTRHTMASLMVENGVPIEEVQVLLRHRSIKSTEIYATVSTKRLRESLNKYWKEYSL